MDQSFNHCTHESWNTGHHQASASAFIPTSQSQIAVQRPTFAPTDFQDSNLISETTKDSVYTPPFSRLSLPPGNSFPRLSESCQNQDGLLHCQVRGPSSRNMLYKGEFQDAREHSPGEWDLHRNEVKRLYLMEKKTLKQLMEEMYKKYGFVAT